MKLPICFIDSFAPLYPEDATQQMHFKEETDMLWDFAQLSPEFKFKTIDELLLENYLMKEEIKWLNNVITDNITELKGIKS